MRIYIYRSLTKCTLLMIISLIRYDVIFLLRYVGRYTHYFERIYSEPGTYTYLLLIRYDAMFMQSMLNMQYIFHEIDTLIQ